MTLAAETASAFNACFAHSGVPGAIVASGRVGVVACLLYPLISMAQDPLIVDVFCPATSLGLKKDAFVIAGAVRNFARLKARVRIIWVPQSVITSPSMPVSLPETDPNPGTVAIFIERVFEAEFLQSYRQRLLYINPEWTNIETLKIINKYDIDIVHKSKSLRVLLSQNIPSKKHFYTGFSSISFPGSVNKFETAVHLAGKSKHRSTQKLLDVWQANPHWPQLKIQAYGRHAQLETNGWFRRGNVDLYQGQLDETEYGELLQTNGIHLCLSQVEGFGHYINESRAMGALILTLDAPPMNELVTNETGILIPARKYAPMGLGHVFEANSEDIQAGIENALTMSQSEKAQLGAAAREAYFTGRTAFIKNLEELLTSLAA